ncbi:Outer membrane protein assembly factor BamE [bacterium HR37]|nr:Outer membrane protein assembly factor BamE [bacterium HR37]
MINKRRAFALVAIFLIFGCASAAQHQQKLHSSQERETTVGIVQKEIRTGMSQDQVATILGSPNIVTRDSSGKETWIYDKIATEASYSRDSGGTGLILSLIGVYSREAGAFSTTQKTLTVIVKFNKDGLVESFSYHASKF